MVVCKNCEHENPEGATICETCYTPLSITNTEDKIKCSSCGADTLNESTFCGQCGFNLDATKGELEKRVFNNLPDNQDNLNGSAESEDFEFQANKSNDQSYSLVSSTESENIDKQEKLNKTELQLQRVTLFHLQTETEIDIPLNLSVIHIGKVNSRVPPDIDISGFPDSQIVSRVHADILQEGDSFFIEDTGSANGTYINHIPLPVVNRQRLRNGDRIALGKEDKVSFIFKITEK